MGGALSGRESMATEREPDFSDASSALARCRSSPRVARRPARVEAGQEAAEQDPTRDVRGCPRAKEITLGHGRLGRMQRVEPGLEIDRGGVGQAQPQLVRPTSTSTPGTRRRRDRSGLMASRGPMATPRARGLRAARCVAPAAADAWPGRRRQWPWRAGRLSSSQPRSAVRTRSAPQSWIRSGASGKVATRYPQPHSGEIVQANYQEATMAQVEARLGSAETGFVGFLSSLRGCARLAPSSV